MKSLLNTRLSAATAVSADGTIPLGVAVHGTGSAITLSGTNTIKLSGSRGYYRILAHCSCAPTAAGSVTFSVLDGTTVLDTATGTSAAAGNSVDMTVIATIYIPCGCGCSGVHTISFQLNAAASVTDMAVEVEQL